MEIGFDPAKREWTLEHRGLDFADAEKVFAGPRYTFEDNRRDYGETRYLTFGRLEDRLLAIAWTPRGDTRHIISMRKANGREKRRYESRLG